MIREDWIVLFDTYQIVFWSVLYFECIRIAFKENTYTVPYIAICMNFSWEVLALVDYMLNGPRAMHILILYLIWALMDSAVVYTYFKYGKNELIRKANNINKIFWSYSLIIAFLVVGVLLLMYFRFDYWKGWFSYADNVIMSALFIAMLYVRKGSRGQSMSIAFTKCIGTLCATITMVLNGSYVLFAMGIGCFVLDVAYIILLYRTIQIEKSIVRLPKRKKSKA